MIIVTGAAGFIGSALTGELLRAGYGGIVAVDDFSQAVKNKNLAGKKIENKIERGEFLSWINTRAEEVQFIFHIGARTNTAEKDAAVLKALNLDFSKSLWTLCTEHSIPLIYASSAATYGAGEMGFSDEQDLHGLRPLNLYGQSKHDFDIWAQEQAATGMAPPFWAGFKFFNVFGPNEYHKGRMASVVLHAHSQMTATGRVNLFRSHRPDYSDGGQLRDFIYVKDLLAVLLHFMENRRHSGLYNLGTGTARSFEDLALATFAANGLPAHIDYIDIPEDIREKYQYYTRAEMGKLSRSGCPVQFSSLEDAILDYVSNYLKTGAYL